MIFEFLLPIIGWLVLFLIFFLIYTKFFPSENKTKVEGQMLYTTGAAFFWILVYLTLSSIWSIAYSLIDLAYPDIIGAATNYGSGLGNVGVVFDAFAFPLATVLVSSILAFILAIFLNKKFNENENLKPENLYKFLRALVFIGGAIFAFSGFVYIVYSWLYGNLPIAVFMKGGVAFVIIALVALYFYLDKYANIFAGLLLLGTIATLVVSFKVIGTPAEARLYRLDNITLQNLQTVKYEIDNQSQSFGKKILTLDELTDYNLKNILSKTKIKYSYNLKENTKEIESYNLCADFNFDMPKSINNGYENHEWDYKKGESCFTYDFKLPYVNIPIKPQVLK